MKKHGTTKERNWALVFVSSILILIGLALMVMAVLYIASFGWWSLAVGLAGLSIVGAAVMSIITNDPVWILLNLIIPS